MKRSFLYGLLLVAFVGLSLFAFADTPKPTTPPITYERDILPLLQARCFGCHGAGMAQAGLDLRTLGSALQGGNFGTAIVVGTPEKSRLYTAVKSGKMPPSPNKLSASEVQKIAHWIETGAKGSTKESGHWAFRAPICPPVPSVKAANPIDSFIVSALQKKGLSLSPRADRRTLLRRVTYDLIGLPPTPKEVADFLADTSPNAYEKVVNRLLADSRYGERWARYWLDTAGYADSEGVLQEDRIRENAWRYRDYVIRSLNADKPYNRFLKEQIAGDELSGYRNAKQWTPEIEEAVTATGFLRTAVDATRDDFNEHQFTEYQYRMLHDTQTILVSSTLGVTLQCARCHDHKYEPLSQKDYYRLQAILAGAIRPTGKLLPTYRRVIVAGTAEEQTHAKAVNAQVDTALQGLVQREQRLIGEYRAKLKGSPNASVEVLSKQFPAFQSELKAIAEARAKEEGKRVRLQEIRALYDQDTQPPTTHILLRGEYTKLGEAVEPGIPAVLNDPKHPFQLPAIAKEANTTRRRLALAEWITRPDNPLTARVLVNRVWAHHFGVGIVPSIENFGRSGQQPTHPQLLDWLATQFVRGIAGSSAWTLKPLHRLIVTSDTYCQASAYRPECAAKDVENRLLWRQRARRLEAEAIRDGILATTGTLDTTMYGAPIGNEMRDTGEIVASGEEKGGRRSLYLLVRRSLPVTFLNVFDSPVMETNCTRRATSTTPTQALTLLNSRFMMTQAAHFAGRVLRETQAEKPLSDYETLKSRIRKAYLLALVRPPSENEMREALGFVQSQTLRYQRTGKSADVAASTALADFCLALLSANEFVYID